MSRLVMFLLVLVSPVAAQGPPFDPPGPPTTILNMTEYQLFVFMAFVMAGFGSVGGVPFQGLMYLLAVIFTVGNDAQVFVLYTGMFLVITLYVRAKRAIGAK